MSDVSHAHTDSIVTDIYALEKAIKTNATSRILITINTQIRVSKGMLLPGNIDMHIVGNGGFYV